MSTLKPLSLPFVGQTGGSGAITPFFFTKMYRRPVLSSSAAAVEQFFLTHIPERSVSLGSIIRTSLPISPCIAPRSIREVNLEHSLSHVPLAVSTASC